MLPVGRWILGSDEEGNVPRKRINMRDVSRSSRPELRDITEKEVMFQETKWVMRRRKTGRHHIGG